MAPIVKKLETTDLHLLRLASASSSCQPDTIPYRQVRDHYLAQNGTCLDRRQMVAFDFISHPYYKRFESFFCERDGAKDWVPNSFSEQVGRQIAILYKLQTLFTDIIWSSKTRRHTGHFFVHENFWGHLRRHEYHTPEIRNGHN